MLVAYGTTTLANADMGGMRGLDGGQKPIGAAGERPNAQDRLIMQDLIVVGAQRRSSRSSKKVSISQRKATQPTTCSSVAFRSLVTK